MAYRNVLLFGTALSALPALFSSPVHAQASPSAFTAGMRYDAARRVTGTISPDPDGAGPLPFRAVRNTYDAGGRLTRVERGTLSAWQSEAVAPASWSGFTVLETVQSSYDNGDRKIRDIVSGGGTVYSVTQYSYDTLGRPRCTGVRMNPAIFPNAAGAGGSLPADACTAGTASTTYGPDRITRTTSNWRGDVMRQETGVGTSERRDVATYNYTLDGQVQTITDANGNMSSFNYDGHDRMNYMFFPSATLPGEANGSDYEQYTLDANGNRTSVRRRDGQVINYTYDALNRMTLKDLPGTEPDVTYAYDNLGRMTQAARPSQPIDNINFTYDALGRRRTESSWVGTATSLYDAAGRRSRLTYPGSGLYVDYDYLDTGEMTRIRENGATSGVGVLVAFGYDGLGRRTSLTRGNGLVTSYGYDGVSRLASLGHDFVSPGGDVSMTFARNPAGQIATRTVSNTAYSFPASAVSVTDAHNGLNQITTTGGMSVTHDARGNVSVIGTAGYQYTSENQLRIGAGGAALAYDPLGRLYFAGISPPSRYLGYEGDRQIAEYDGYAGVLRRYVHGPGTDEPLVWYEGAGTGDRRWFHADERGSIVAVSAGSGGSEAIIRYDEYGRPHGPDGAGTMPTRFGYTGQAWVSEIGMWYYKARIFNSALSRFMQSDPSGYEDGPNIYAYVQGDPVNRADPTGRIACDSPSQNHVCMAQYRRAQEIAAARQQGVARAWAAEKRLVAAGSGTRNWTRAERAELLQTGRVRGYVGHHRNTVNGNPIEMARDPRNISFLTRAEHVEVHRAAGGYRVPITGQSLINRSYGPLSIFTGITGILSGRIRVDSLDNMISDVLGLPSTDDVNDYYRQLCGPNNPEGRPCA